MRKIIAGIFLSLVLIFTACNKNSEPAVSCSNVTVSYATEVNPIIQTNCATYSACHGLNSTNGPGTLATYTQIFNARASIKTAVQNGSMPKDHTLTSDQKTKIVCWIENGAANN